MEKEKQGIGHRNAILGKKGEEAAEKLLIRKGYEILERNWVCPYGEADIICREEDYLVFVEVKTRTGIEHGLPEEAVDAKKRKKYEQIAACYLQQSDYRDIGLRFDIISILVLSNDSAMIRHYINAWGRI